MWVVALMWDFPRSALSPPGNLDPECLNEQALDFAPQSTVARTGARTLLSRKALTRTVRGRAAIEPRNGTVWGRKDA